MALKLRGDELRTAFAKLRGCLTEGLDEGETTQRLGLPWEEMLELKRRFYDNEAEILRNRSTEHSFVRYVVEQRQCLHDLESVISDYQTQKNVAAYVGAVRAKSDIMDRILKTGVDLGLIDRVQEGKGYAAGEAIKGMPNVELRQYIVAEMRVFNEWMLRFGDQGIVDVSTGPLHRPQQKEKTPVRGHARTKVHGGRRVVREKGGA